MTTEEFAQRMFDNAVVSGVNACIRALQSPPGRKPHSFVIEESSWFNNLTSVDQALVQRCMTRAAEMALFSVFTVLDGVSSIEEVGTKGEFRLFFEKGGERTLVNPRNGDMLHELMPQTTK